MNLLDAFHANLAMPLALIEAASKAGVRSFINFNTFYPMGYLRMFNYTTTKHHFSQYLPLFRDRLAVFDCTLGHIYGEHDSDDKFIPYLMNTLAMNGPELALTHGRQKRQFVHADDVVDACMKILRANNSAGYYRYELCGDEKKTIRECVELIKMISGNTATKLCFGARNCPADEIMDMHLKNAPFKKAFGWKPRVNLKDGVTRCINALKQKK